MRGRRRRRALLGAVLALAALYTGLAAVRGERSMGDDAGAGRASTLAWPARGQAAIALGEGAAAASPRERPVPIASVAKVMTAYLTLVHDPLSGDEAGFETTATDADVQAEARDVAERQSDVAIRAGEQLSERELLQALLVPSGNDIARILAARVAGSESRFVAGMNAQARALGMADTTYTDPAGFDPGTVSTAADQLRVLRRAMRFPVFRQIVSMPTVTLPVAGTLRNFNPLVAEGYGGKTGSDSAAGGCLAFFTDVGTGAGRRTAAGVVLGQGTGSDTSEILAAAGDAARRLVESAARRPAPRDR